MTLRPTRRVGSYHAPPPLQIADCGFQKVTGNPAFCNPAITLRPQDILRSCNIRPLVAAISQEIRRYGLLKTVVAREAFDFAGPLIRRALDRAPAQSGAAAIDVHLRAASHTRPSRQSRQSRTCLGSSSSRSYGHMFIGHVLMSRASSTTGRPLAGFSVRTLSRRRFAAAPRWWPSRSLTGSDQLRDGDHRGCSRKARSLANARAGRRLPASAERVGGHVRSTSGLRLGRMRESARPETEHPCSSASR